LFTRSIIPYVTLPAIDFDPQNSTAQGRGGVGGRISVFHRAAPFWSEKVRDFTEQGSPSKESENPRDLPRVNSLRRVAQCLGRGFRSQPQRNRCPDWKEGKTHKTAIPAVLRPFILPPRSRDNGGKKEAIERIGKKAGKVGLHSSQMLTVVLIREYFRRAHRMIGTHLRDLCFFARSNEQRSKWRAQRNKGPHAGEYQSFGIVCLSGIAWAAGRAFFPTQRPGRTNETEWI
jgi:hypothetical protein